MNDDHQERTCAVTNFSAILLMTLVVSASVQSQAPPVDQAAVERALANPGRSAGLTMTEAFNMSASGFRIQVYSPIAWIRAEAIRARQEMRHFTIADITPEMRADVWRVKAYPSTPRKVDETFSVSSVSHVVIRNRDKTVIIQPIEKVPFPHTLQTLGGMTLTLEGLDLEFPGAEVAKLWGERQSTPFWISVVGPDWKYDYEVKAKHFERLR